MVALFIGMIVVQYVRCMRSPRPVLRFAACGLGFGLIAILIHSFSDFGQHLPANTFLTCAASALLVNMGALRSRNADASDTAVRAGSRVVRSVAAGVFLLVVLWVLSGAQ